MKLIIFSIGRLILGGSNHLNHSHMGVSKNRGVSPQIIHSNRVFHYKPSIFGYPLFSETSISKSNRKDVMFVGAREESSRNSRHIHANSQQEKNLWPMAIISTTPVCEHPLMKGICFKKIEMSDLSSSGDHAS